MVKLSKVPKTKFTDLVGEALKKALTDFEEVSSETVMDYLPLDVKCKTNPLKVRAAIEGAFCESLLYLIEVGTPGKRAQKCIFGCLRTKAGLPIMTMDDWGK